MPQSQFDFRQRIARALMPRATFLETRLATGRQGRIFEDPEALLREPWSA